MKRVLLMSIALSCAPSAPAALPGDSAEGKKVYEANCVGCHDASVYTRNTRKVKSLPALSEQLNACVHSAQVTLSDAEQQNLVKYLNEQFYKFK